MEQQTRTRKGLLANTRGNLNLEIRKKYVQLLETSDFSNLKQWAEAADINYMTFHSYSTGSSIPKVDVASRIAEVAGGKISDLYDFRKDKTTQ